MSAAKKPPPDIPSYDAEYRRQVAYAEAKYGRPIDVPKPTVDAPSAESYSRLKRELLLDTLFLGAVGLAPVVAFFSRDVVGSYVLGWAAAVVYVRLLTRGVDRMAPGLPADSLAPARLALLGLLVVVVGRHREDWGTQLIPTLAGLATYKLATIWKVVTGGDLDPMFDQEEQEE